MKAGRMIKTCGRFKSLFAMAVMACLALAAQASPNVFDDAVFWFRGGNDKNSDGYIDQGEFFDDLRAETPADGNHNMTMASTLYIGEYGSLFKGNAVFRNEQVVFPALGASAAKDDVQVLHISDAAVNYNSKDYYFPFAVNPRHIFARNEVSNEYTIVSRIRLDDDNTHRSFEKCFLKIGYDNNQGMWLGFKAQNTSKGCRQITGKRIDSTGADSAFDLDLHVPTNTWVDLAVVVGNGKLRVGIATPATNRYNNSTITFAETDVRTDNYELLEDPDDAYYMLFCRDGQKTHAQAGGTDKTAFIGSVQQLAIWRRALTDQEVMDAFGMPRPAIFRTGFDNDVSNEFGGERIGSSQTIDGLGSWQNIANTMKAGDTWTVNFNALRDEAGLPQIFSIKSLRGSSAQIEVTLNNASHNTSLGENRVGSEGRTFWPVPENLITAGANTLVISRTDGGARDFVVDAMELGGSLGVGTISGSSTDDGRVDPELISTGVPSAADPNPQHWPTKLRPSTNKDLHFRVWVDPDVLDKASFTLKTAYKCDANSASDTFTVYVNRNSKGEIKASTAWAQPSISLKAPALQAGWNDIDFYSTATSRYWDFGYYRFEAVLPNAFAYPTPPGFSIIVR